MKQWTYVLMLCLFMASCDEDIDVYQGGSSIYFDNQGFDTLWIPWGSVATEEKKMDLDLRVELFGAVKDYARKFRIEVVSDVSDSLHAVEGVDYSPIPLEYEMPAWENHTFIPIELLRTDTLLKQARRFTIKLLANEDFGFEYMGYRLMPDSSYMMTDDHVVIYMDEEFPRPWWWYRIGTPIFGEWSRKKGILICDVAGIDREKFQGELDGKDGNLTVGYLKFVGRKVHLWLQDNPTEDENGELMVMGEESIY